jgi:hypothetical protein
MSKQINNKKEVRLRRAQPHRLFLDTHARQAFCLDVEHGVTKEDLLRPEFYAGIAPKLKPFYKIEVRAEDLSFYAELLVLQATKTAAKVTILNFLELSSPSSSDLKELNGFLVEYKGLNQWCVIRKSDNALIEKNHATEADALGALKNHINAMGK